MLGCGRVGRVHARNVSAHSCTRLAVRFDVVREAAEAALHRRAGALRLADAALESLRTGRTVRLDG